MDRTMKVTIAVEPSRLVRHNNIKAEEGNSSLLERRDNEHQERKRERQKVIKISA